NYPAPRVLEHINKIILPKYKEVAWSQNFVIAEDAIPPPGVLTKNPSFGRPHVDTVIEHLCFLRGLLNHEEWKKSWREAFTYCVYEVYRWLEKECSNEDVNLAEKLENKEKRLFLNCNENSDVFDPNNWVS